MNADRRIRLWSLVVEFANGRPVTVEHVCAAVLSAAGVDQAAVTVTLGGQPPRNAARQRPGGRRGGGADPDPRRGHGVDACTGDPALAADLTAPDCLARWPVFAPAALYAGGPCDVRAGPEQAGSPHPEVHQATGMITVQLGVSMAGGPGPATRLRLRP